MKKKTIAITLTLTATLFAQLADLSIVSNGYILVPNSRGTYEERLDRTHSRFIYRATLFNGGAPLVRTIHAFGTSNNPSVVCEFPCAISFSPVDTGQMEVSSDTFTVVFDRTQVFSFPNWVFGS